MPKEVEAVVLETTALNCPCTFNVHERIVQERISRRNRNIQTFCTENKKGVRTVEDFLVLVIGITL